MSQAGTPGPSAEANSSGGPQAIAPAPSAQTPGNDKDKNKKEKDKTAPKRAYKKRVKAGAVAPDGTPAAAATPDSNPQKAIQGRVVEGPPAKRRDDGSMKQDRTEERMSAPGPAQGASQPVAERVKKTSERQKLHRKNLFAKDLPSMMYAFGDDPDPLPESILVLEEIMVDYIGDLCKSAASHSTNAKKLKLDDLRFALRKPQQAKQLARVEELLYLQEDIARARKNFDITHEQ